MSRASTHAFGYEFTHVPESLCADVVSLEREGVLYDDHWIDELQDFRHVRIALSENERGDYARRTWAYELYLRAGQPEWARDVPDIDRDIAKEADEYTLVNFVDGTKIGPPCHCFAAFLGYHLEALACGGFPDRETIIELQGRESALFTLGRAVQALTPTIRAFNLREKHLQPWQVSREDDVRDLL